MILLHSTNFSSKFIFILFIWCALLAFLASLSHGHLVTTECLYLALLLLTTNFLHASAFTGSLSISVDRCCISLPIYYSNDFTYSTTRQQDALIHSYQRTKNCIILRASEPGNIQTLRWANTNWVHTNANKHNQADCGERILFAFASHFFFFDVKVRKTSTFSVFHQLWFASFTSARGWKVSFLIF